jgi:hypothetical protein
VLRISVENDVRDHDWGDHAQPLLRSLAFRQVAPYARSSPEFVANVKEITRFLLRSA